MGTFLFLLPILLSQAGCSDYPPPREPFTLSWTGGPFVWPSENVRFMYKSTGKFIPKNMIATRAVVFRDDLYVVFPRYLPGVAATLARTSLLCPNCEAVFEPFPSWKAQTEGDCDALQNAVDVFLDRRDVMWVLDTGVTQVLDSPVRECSPKAVGYDLTTGKQVHKVDLSDLATNTSRLQYLVADVDTRGPRDRRFLYISDAGNRAVLVYNLTQNSGYRLVLPERVETGCPTGCPDVLYLALAKPRSGGRRIYLTYLCSSNVFYIHTKDLQSGADGSVLPVNGEKSQKIVFIGTDNLNTVYFRYEGKGDVFSWDVNTDLVSENIKQVHRGGCCLLATSAVMDPFRLKMRILQSNFLDFLRKTVGMGATHVMRSIG